MRLLLDTHVLLWAFASPQRLSPRARDAISNRSNQVLVSAVSAWEISTKHRLGKLPDAESVVMAYPEHLARLGATELPLSSRHAIEAGALPWDHRDPFDRMLAAQAMIESATLVSVDRVFSELGAVRLMA